LLKNVKKKNEELKVVEVEDGDEEDLEYHAGTYQ
jgi:hypothetical protein